METIKTILEQAIKNVFGIDFDVEITEAPADTGADFASNVAMKLAKEVHKNPKEIADILVEQMELDNAKFFSVEVSPQGFLNFYLSSEYLLQKIVGMNQDFAKNISCNEYLGKTVICEFSDPNPFKVLHAGHLYTSIVGDAISRLYEYAGAKVIRANFGGDVGLHVAKTLYILKERQLDVITMDNIAECYIEGTRAYDENAAATTKITELNKQIYQINQENIHGNDLADLYWYTRELSYQYFDEFYHKIGVKFDKYYPESTVAGLGLKKVQEQLQKGVYKSSDGAVVFKGEDFGLHTRVFINKEGVPTYEAKDVGLIFTKWQDYKFDKSIVITGNEQLDYMKVVLKSIEQYAPELVEKTVHLTHGLVRLPGNVKMSSRLGNGLKATDVLDVVAEELKKEYGSEDFKIVLAATKYAFLKYKMGGNIVFDPKESVKMTGNSGTYLLYSCVRAKKVLQKVYKMSSSGRDSSLSSQVSSLSPRSNCGFPSEDNFINFDLNIFEHSLSKKIVQYRDILREAVAEIAPHKIVNYLFNLAQEFSKFYENCPVVGSAEEPQRIEFVQSYLNVMEHGLKILGIEIPEEM